MSEPTPRPWKADHNQIWADDKPQHLADFYGSNDEVNLDLCIRAVNALDDLVASCNIARLTLRNIADVIAGTPHKSSVLYAVAELESALAKAKGDEG